MQLKLPIQNEDSDFNLDDSPKKSKNNTCCDSMTATFPLCLDYQVLACYSYFVYAFFLHYYTYEEIEQQNTHLNYSRLNMYRTYIDDVIVIVSIYT